MCGKIRQAHIGNLKTETINTDRTPTTEEN